jgi:hypothetical protein
VPEAAPLKVMVSSTVYNQEYELKQLFAVLEGYGYEVLMSHRGTIPVDPSKHNFKNCLAAVDSCDLFIGIVNSRYGADGGGPISIAHQEIRRAIELDKPRWMLVHYDLWIIRQVLRQFRKKGGQGWQRKIQGCPAMDDIRILDLIEEILQSDVPFEQRRAWAQPYFDHGDLMRFISAQLGNEAYIRGILAEREQ